MLPICICYAAHAQKQHFNLNHKVWARPKETNSRFRNRLDLWLAQNSWSTDLDWSQLSINNVLRTSLLKEKFNPGITSMGGFQNYQTTFGITKQTSCNDKVPSSTDSDSWPRSGHGTLGFLTTLHSHDLGFIPDGPTSEGEVFHAEGLRWLGPRLNSRFTLDILNIFFLRWSRDDRFWGWNG
jgi:hypothetical protein